jgi:6,7-dimethyl-8-ribityllumazine synthase
MGIKSKSEKKFVFDPEQAGKIKIGIVISEWNDQVTSALLNGCLSVLKKYKIPEENIIQKWVPGSFELALGGQWIVEKFNADAVICIGCVIKGETPHFHYIAETVANNIGDLSLKYGRPFIFCVLTTENEQHAIERAGGKAGNKGEDAAYAALKMIQLKSDLKKHGKNIGYF